ncbi:MAG: MBL fold metallo-hydrolase [Myxococcaceae bacterium]|nr:MBL fold metallo-hydrolase [Myxococcaceae bacterium]
MRFWGVRGSVPSPGPNTARYGGNTPCVEMRAGGHQLIFDLGTGVRVLGEQSPRPLNAHVFVSHYHYDHLQGLPFFTPMFDPRNQFVFHGPTRGTRTVKDVIEEQMQQPFFPVTAQMVFRAQSAYEPIAEGQTVTIGGITVQALEVNHPGGNLSYRIEFGGRTVVYATDAEHGKDDDRLTAFAKGADLFIYDAMYSEEEYRGQSGGPPKLGWGHSTWQHAITMANAAQVKQLCLFHHEPVRTDAQLDAIMRQVKKVRPDAVAAKEGQLISL